MKITNVMSRNVEVVPPEATCAHAAERMRALDVGALPVCSGDKIVGMITDRDIVVRCIADGRDPKSASVADVMSGDVVWCSIDDGVEEVSRRMQEAQVRRIVVVDRDKKLVGIVAMADLATKRGNADVTSRTIEKISRPAHDGQPAPR